jgi:hypothetical protein
LIIDKQKHHIAYNDNTHTYWNVKTNEVYSSITSIIKLFKQDFDKLFFAKYKAIQELEPIYFQELKSIYGFKEVVNLYELDNYDNKQYITKTNNILMKWEAKNKEAITKGLNIHKEKENTIINNKSFTLFDTKYTYSNELLHNNKNEVLTEYIVYNDTYKLAGTVDLILKNDNNEIIIIDHKTNEKIDKKNFFSKMKFPLDHLDDCNFNHYSLQLSLYAYFIEKHNFTIKQLYINHIKNNKDNYIEIPYLKQDIILMLECQEGLW